MSADGGIKNLLILCVILLILTFISIFCVFPFVYSTYVLKQDYHPINSIKSSLTLNGKLFKSKEVKEREEWFAKIEAYVNKICPKIDIKQQQENGEGIYDFYIHPKVWEQLSEEQKDVIYQKCVMYVYLKINPKDKLAHKRCTKIKSLTDGEVLAESVNYVPKYK